jgi:hypothetical protein
VNTRNREAQPLPPASREGYGVATMDGRFRWRLGACR